MSTQRYSWLITRGLSALSVVLTLGGSAIAPAATTNNWSDGTSNWNNGANWTNAFNSSIHVVPAAGDTVNIVNADGVARIVTYDINAPTLGPVTVDLTGAGATTNTLSISAFNTFNVGGLVTVGSSGRGSIIQPDFSTITISGTNSLFLGNNAGSVGAYSLSGILSVSGNENIGLSGTGTFTQSGGNNNLTLDMVMGFNAPALGTFTLSGGTFFTGGSQYVGYSATGNGSQSGGTFNQTGGSNTVSSTLYLGYNSGATGSYTISNSSTLSAGSLVVGNSGTGTITIQDQASVSVTNSLTINGSSTVSLNGGTLRVNTVTGLNRLIYNSGTVKLAGDRTIGFDSIVSSLFGSSVPVNKGLTVEGNAFISSNPGTLFSLSVEGMLTSLSTLQVGGAGDGSLLVDGGHVVSQNGIIGPNTGNSNSTVTVSGPGSSWGVNNSLTIGAATKGTLTIQDQGLVFVGNQLTIASQSTVNLFNGTLRFNTYSRAAGGVFNFYGGTVQLQGSRSVGTDPAIIDLFGGVPTITAGKGLTVEGAATLLTTLLIDGGTFTAPSIVGGQNLQLRRGTFNLTSASLVVGSGGLLGSTLDLPADMTVNVTQGTTNQGLVTGDGQIGGTFTNASTGELRAEPGKSLKLTGANNTNAGQINLYGGQLEFTQTLTNGAGAFISGNGTIKTSALTNNGTMNFSGLANVVGDVTNSPTGKIISSGGGPTTFFDDVVNNGEIRTSTGGFTVFFGAVSGSGSYTGAGTVNFEGDLNPGNSPATVALAGNVALGSVATLNIELAGTTPGAQFDQIHVAGALSLAGTLNVSLINSFSPLPGNRFDILDWNTLSGTFSSVQLPSLTGSLAWNTSQLYATGVLSVIDTNFLPGDVDRDGHVTVADIQAMMSALSGLNAYQSTHGPGGGALTNSQLLQIADLTGDGKVTNGDVQGLIVYLADGGNTGGGSLTAVPEPASITLLAAGSLILTASRARTQVRRAT